MNTADIARATAACLVADRAHLEDARRFCGQLGGYWRDGVEVPKAEEVVGAIVLADAVPKGHA